MQEFKRALEAAVDDKSLYDISTTRMPTLEGSNDRGELDGSFFALSMALEGIIVCSLFISLFAFFLFLSVIFCF